MSLTRHNHFFRKDSECPSCGHPIGDDYDGGIGEICPTCKWEIGPCNPNGCLNEAQWIEAITPNGVMLKPYSEEWNQAIEDAEERAISLMPPAQRKALGLE